MRVMQRLNVIIAKDSQSVKAVICMKAAKTVHENGENGQPSFKYRMAYEGRLKIQ